MKSSVAWYPAERSWPDAIGIDFGTSTLAVAYKVEGTVHPLNIQEECHDAYVPTVLLMTKNSGQLEIGHRALKNYCQCGIAEETDCIFFKQVKLQLHDDEVGHLSQCRVALDLLSHMHESSRRPPCNVSRVERAICMCLVSYHIRKKIPYHSTSIVNSQLRLNVLLAA